MLIIGSPEYLDNVIEGLEQQGYNLVPWHIVSSGRAFRDYSIKKSGDNYCLFIGPYEGCRVYEDPPDDIKRYAGRHDEIALHDGEIAK